MPRIRFTETGQWADPSEPRPRKVFKVTPGEEREVSEQFVKNLLASGKGELVEPGSEPKSQDDPTPEPQDDPTPEPQDELEPAAVQKAEKKAPKKKEKRILRDILS